MKALFLRIVALGHDEKLFPVRDSVSLNTERGEKNLTEGLKCFEFLFEMKTC